jgi:hypothetical protein
MLCPRCQNLYCTHIPEKRGQTPEDITAGHEEVRKQRMAASKTPIIITAMGIICDKNVRPIVKHK